MFDNLLNHIKEQREKRQYINAIATTIELHNLLLKEFSDLQKRKEFRELKLLYKNGEPCKHPGCRSHISHPCEGCGRFGAQGEVYAF